jgi:hypothetical protein
MLLVGGVNRQRPATRSGVHAIDDGGCNTVQHVVRQ